MASPRSRPVLDLRPADGALALWQRRYFDLDLPPALSTQAFARAARQRLAPAVRAEGLTAWRHRTLDEYRSQVAFTEFLHEVTELGCSYDILAAAVRLVRDEARHVEICRRMVLALGGEDVVPGEPQYVRSDQRADLFERVLLTTVASLCVGETFSVAFLAASKARASHPLSRAALTQLAKDESIHSQLGWRLFPLLWPLAVPKVRKRVVGLLPALFEQSWAALFEGLSPRRRVRAGGAFGDLAPAERQRVWDEALEKDVVRRFEAHGVPARDAARAALATRPRFD